MEKAVVGISGGVDSAVCAARLKARDFDVTGVFLDSGHQPPEAARAVCEQLDIPFITEDITALLEERVIRPFAQGYNSGVTPNPCVLCNPTVKFPALAKVADRIGARRIATGHYAALETRDRVTRLYQGKPGRDQSYMLYRLLSMQGILQRCLFPLCDDDKDTVRADARALGLDAAEAPDSMDVCFVQDGGYAEYVERLGCGTPPGDFVDADGAVLGRHEGIHRYTIGQRRGTGISSDSRLFVTRLDARRNQVTLGGEDRLYPESITAGHLILSPGVTLPFEADVRVRIGSEAARAAVTPLSGGRALITFTQKPARAPTPAQSAVFYIDNMVAGGGIIL